VLDVYEDNKTIIVLFTNKIDKIDKKLKLNLNSFFNLLSKFNYRVFEIKATKS